MSSESATLGVSRFGPRDRESFLDAQRRSRRATGRMSFFCLLAAFAMGIPLTLALSPLIYFVVLVGAEVYNYYSPLPKDFWIDVGNLAHLAQRVAGAVFNHKPIDPETAVLGSLVFFYRFFFGLAFLRCFAEAASEALYSILPRASQTRVT